MPYDKPVRILMEMKSGYTFTANENMIKQFVAAIKTDPQDLLEETGRPAKIPEITKLELTVVIEGNMDQEGYNLLWIEDD